MTASSLLAHLLDRAVSGVSGRCDAVTTQAGVHGQHYRGGMRRLLPWIVGFAVLVLLWPAVCMSSEDGPTSCQSAVLLPLPWGETADSWGMGVAVAAAVLAYFAVRYMLRRTARR